MEANERIVQGLLDKKIYSEKIVNHDVDLKRWKIKSLYKDSLWVKLLDEPDADLVQKGSLLLRPASYKGPYRLGEVVMAGPDVTHAQVGDRVLIPQQVGQPGHSSYEGYKTWFVREDAVVATLMFDGTDIEMSADIEDQILLPL